MRSNASENKKREQKDKNDLPREIVVEILQESACLSGHKALALILSLAKKAKKNQKSNFLVN